MKKIKIIALWIFYITNAIATETLEMPENLMVYENEKVIANVDDQLNQDDIKNKCNSEQGCYVKFDLNIFKQKLNVILPVSVRCVRANECSYQVNDITSIVIDDIKRKALIKSQGMYTNDFYELTIWSVPKNNYNLMTMEIVYQRSYAEDGMEVFIQKLNYRHLPSELNLMKRKEKILKEKPMICLYPKEIEECLKDKLIIEGNLIFKENQDILPLQKNNVLYYNDTAYYLEQAGAYEESAYLLEKILEKYPDRTVAHYNLGDAYWGLGEKEKAIASYNTYIQQMKANGKEKRIPQVVLDRVNTKEAVK